MSMQLHWHPLSHNARVVNWFAVASGIPLQLKFVDLASLEHKKLEFLSINPAGEIPAFKDGNLHLFEGSSIIRYLAIKTQSELYPFDNPKRLGSIDSAYQWIRSNFWNSVQAISFQTFILPHLMGGKTDQDLLKRAQDKFQNELNFLNDYYFENPAFVVGNWLSVADIGLGTCLFHLSHFAQPRLNLYGFPKIEAYWKTLQQTDHFKKAHAPVFEFLQSLKPPESTSSSSSSEVKSTQKRAIQEEEKEDTQEKVPQKGWKNATNSSKGEVVSTILPATISSPDDEKIITYYHFPGSRSSRPLWLAYELGLGAKESSGQFRVQQVMELDGKWKGLKREAFLEINPNGLIPALTIGTEKNLDQIKLFEAGAIINALMDANFFPYVDKAKISQLLPKDKWTPEQLANHYVYSTWCIVTMDAKLVSGVFGVGKLTNMFTGGVRKWFQGVAQEKLENDLGEKNYMQGDEFTLTDIYVGYSLFWASYLGLLKDSPRLSAYLRRVSSRPAWKQSFPVYQAQT